MLFTIQLNFFKCTLRLLLIGFLICTACSNPKTPKSNKKTQELPIQAKAKPNYTFVLFPIEQTIQFKTNGKIEYLCQPGFVKKGKRIALLDNKKLFQSISSKKLILQSELNALISKFPAAMKDKATKWEQFSSSISPATRLPKIPKLEFREELETLNEIQFIQQVNEIIRLEQQMKSYFYLAPFSGTFTAEQHLKQGETVSSKEILGTLVQAKKVRVHVSKRDWELCKNHSELVWSDGQIQLSDWKKRDSKHSDSLVFEAESSVQIREKRNWIPIQ